ncbi:MAG: cytidylate kinase family protein [Candidatus Aenigmarchaeota archaeon]|nr:cytidylate kinase family protein [Candidatus Aenigmarchaeota archaeon]
MRYHRILLSGLPGSGKSVLARRLSSHYNWHVHSIGMSWRDEWRRLYPQGDVPFEEFWRGTTMEQNLEANRKAKEIFRAGRIILDTRYPTYYADMPAFSVFLTAPLDVRAERVMRRYPGRSMEYVMEELERREGDELRMGRDLFGCDYSDPLNYHITLNSGRLSPEEKFLIVRSAVEY